MPDREDAALVQRWFQHFQLCVQTRDFAAARLLFAEDAITFGSFGPESIGKQASEAEQWRTVWDRIDQFRWRMDSLRTLTSGDRCMAVGICLFESVGYSETGTAYDRPGRVTVAFEREQIDHDWTAKHMHVSLVGGGVTAHLTHSG